MRQILLIILTITTISITSVNAQISYGGGASLYLESPSSFGIQAKALYDINEDWNASGTFTYYFEDFTFWSFDFDAHYFVTTISDDIALYPFAGLNISRISVSTIFGDVSSSDTNINLGASFQKPMGNMRIYVEPKLIVGDGSALVISGGLLF